MPTTVDPHNAGQVRSRIHWLSHRIQILKKWRAARNRQLKRDLAAAAPGPAKMVTFLRAHVGWHEDAGRPNRAAWLDRWANEIGAWMVGQPWCGLTVWEAAKAAGVKLDKTTVSTVAIRRMAQNGTGGFKAWHPASSAPQVGWVAIYGTAATGPEHTETYVGNGLLIGGNTSPDGGGSQNNGGGIYIKTLAERRGWLLGWAELNWGA